MPHQKNKQPGIVLVAGTILIVVTLLVGVTALIVMQRHAESLLSKSLQVSLQSRVQQIEAEIRGGFDRAALISTRPLLIDQLQLVNSHANADARKKLSVGAQSFLQTGFTAVAFYGKDGQELAHAGIFTQQPELVVPLNLPGHAQLLWDGQLLLRAVVEIKKNGRVVGKVMTEMSLPATMGALKDANRLGETGKLALCAPFGINIQCFPTTLNPKIFMSSQKSPEGVLFPMTHALEGDTGFIITNDYRHQKVAAAYAPVGDLGLGMVLKMDKAELYAPVWQQLRYLIPLLLGVLAVALLLLRRLLNPLVVRLVRSEAEAVQRTVVLTREMTERKQVEQALQASEGRFKTMFVQAPLGIALIDSLNGHIYEANPRFAEIAGRSMEEMANIDWLQITHPDDVQLDLENMALLNAGKINGFQMEKRYLHPDGTVVWINMTISPLNSGDKTHPRHLCMIQDITERKAAEARIRYLNRVHAVLHGINELIVRVQDRDELFREACRIAVEAGGFRMAMLVTIDRNTMKLDPVASVGKDDELLTMIKDRLSSTKDVSTTMVGMAIREKQAIVSNDSLNDPRAVFGKQYADAGIRSFVVLPLIVADEAVGVLALYASEIDFFHEDEMKLLSELVGDIAFAIDHLDKQERLNYLAYYDALTGLANRTLFLERVGQYMRSATKGGHKLALCLIDIERFKNITDSLGRSAGDELLKQVAEWLTHKTADASLLARIDADHFAMVLPEVRQDGDLVKLIEQMAQAFQLHPFRLNDTVLRISAKAGLALFPDDGDNADTLFRNAEAALKKAKASGDRYLFYTQKMTEAVAGKLTLENQLRHAIDNEEFVLHYQPKVNMVSGKVTGAEALIRWNDPRTGLVPPGKFIPLLEETGLIFEVGRWAMRQAIEDNLRWRNAGLPVVRIAVNVSPLQLRNPGFIDEIEHRITYDPHAAEGLELEITESLIMEDVKHNISSLQAIRAMGVTIAIDDFGTGFSSLSYLAKLPVDTLKIDRSFVIEMDSPEGGALVSTIIKLAHSLNFKVVAEGVETEEQSKLLRLLGCDEIQGFLFSKPVPAEIFAAKFLAIAPAK
jgi:diguanylate cyclase (GGDEF)-like protein/PAS domain S-box-containing protein